MADAPRDFLRQLQKLDGASGLSDSGGTAKPDAATLDAAVPEKCAPSGVLPSIEMPTCDTCYLEHVPPLSIRYVLLWTAMTAGALLVFNLLGVQGDRLDAFAGLVVVTSAIALGWLLMALAIIGWHAMRGSVWRLEPGEWLLVGMGGLASMWLLAFLVATRLDPRLFAGVAPITLGLTTVGGAVFQNGVVARSHSPAWRTLHSTNMIAFLLPWCFPLLIFVPPIATPSLVHCIRGDWLRGEPRHWLHYSGIALYGIVIAALLVLEVIAFVIYFM